MNGVQRVVVRKLTKSTARLLNAIDARGAFPTLPLRLIHTPTSMRITRILILTSFGAAMLSTRGAEAQDTRDVLDRKSTRLNSSHMSISYAVFCLKKKKK